MSAGGKREEALERLLSEGLNLCVRARLMDSMDRRAAALDAAGGSEGWQDFDRYVTRHNITNPDQCISTRSGTLPLWVQDQYEKDLADWERRARSFLLGHATGANHDR